MRSGPNLIYRLIHKDYPESFMAYSPQIKDFYNTVHSQLPQGWTIQRREMWFYCSPHNAPLPWQGWKIHVSATYRNAHEILEKVMSILFKYTDVAFKFAADRLLVSLINSKGWPRAGSGKFITIYPPDSRRFIEVIEEIDQATRGMHGPYILSDHRYNNSWVVFYRYGGICTRTDLNVKGEKVPVLKTPDGRLVPDQRLAYPTIPAWEKPVLPLGSETSDDKKEGGPHLLHGRYTIEKAVSFSSAGGVYFAHDNQSGKTVVVKESRPYIAANSDGYDAVELLKKEHRLLTVVADTGIAPQPVDLFQEWEHWFLVEELIEGTEISRHAAAHSLLLRTRPTTDDCRTWHALFRRLCADLMKILNILHSREIVFADLSANNLIITADNQLKIIDFEGAHQLGVDEPANIYTPGFVSQHRVAGGQARCEDDYYSAGAVLLSYLLPINGLLHLNPNARRAFLASIQDDIQLPAAIVELINNLMDQTRFPLSFLVDEIEQPGPSLLRFPRSNVHAPENCEETLESIARHLSGVAEYGRADRLYPSDPRVFSTNPLSLAYGAAGVVYALHKIGGSVPQAAIDWILQRKVNATEYAPSLFTGMSGIAWSLLEIGLRRPAEEIFQSTFTHRLVHKSADLFHGMAGWGMTALRFFRATGNELYLDRAKEAGNRLLESCIKSDRGYSWATSEECPVGLAHGSSGISLFLLYLYLATKNECYLTAGFQGLDFDLAAAVPTKDGGLSWGESMDSPSPLYPYWRFGSAGIGIATVRFQRLTGSTRYQSILEQIFIDTDRKYAVLPGLFTGLTGLGEFLLDMHDLTGEQRFLKSANRISEGIMHFRVERNGAAFPGEMLCRLSCDYGTGSAGIALFLNRLAGKQKNDFMLDELFETLPLVRAGDKNSYRQMALSAA
ncbi:MAG: class III lanthionine synthetase LanKC [Candidatus Angelobacter sp.]